MLCLNCSSPLPEDAKFCPVCGCAVNVQDSSESQPHDEAPEETPSVSSEETETSASGGWYQSSAPEYHAEPVYTAIPAKAPIGSILDFYRQAFAVLAAKPIRLWGLSLLYALIAALIVSLGAAVPLISLPIVLLLQLGFTGVLLDGFHGKEVRSEQLFQSFRKEELLRNAGGMCWQGLWNLIWAFVPVMNVIKYYSYCLVPYILLTDKEVSPTEALRKSMRMTDGYKGKMFGADILLVVAIWVVMLVLGILMRIPYIGWIFGIVFFAAYLAVCLFGTIFFGLVHTAIFEKIREVGNN